MKMDDTNFRHGLVNKKLEGMRMEQVVDERCIISRS